MLKSTHIAAPQIEQEIVVYSQILFHYNSIFVTFQENLRHLVKTYDKSAQDIIHNYTASGNTLLCDFLRVAEKRSSHSTQNLKHQSQGWCFFLVYPLANCVSIDAVNVNSAFATPMAFGKPTVVNVSSMV